MKDTLGVGIGSDGELCVARHALLLSACCGSGRDVQRLVINSCGGAINAWCKTKCKVASSSVCNCDAAVE
jgi:hypothetical protein